MRDVAGGSVLSAAALPVDPVHRGGRRGGLHVHTIEAATQIPDTNADGARSDRAASAERESDVASNPHLVAQSVRRQRSRVSRLRGRQRAARQQFLSHEKPIRLPIAVVFK